jgi:selenoprotein W-related protein
LQEFPAAEIELIRGGGGIFDVVVDGKRVFSKHELGRFPDAGEVTGLLKQA